MRPIDADAFDKALSDAQAKCRGRSGGNFRFGFLSTVRENLANAPTIQPDEPRVMTLDEIREFGDENALFIEYKLPSEIKLRPAIFQPDNSDDEYMCVVSAWCASGFYSCKTYNIDWRCWTARPTEEQREGQEWNGVKG